MKAKPIIEKRVTKSLVSRPRHAVAIAAGIEMEVGSELFAVMDGSDANFYFENDNSPSFAGRAIGADDTWCIKMLCTGGYKPKFRVVRVSEVTATVDVEQIIEGV
jgi:hypothetical protein